MKPIIAITANYSTNDSIGTTAKIGARKQEWQLLADDYIYSIEKAGGIPIILPVVDDVETLKPLLAKVDGLLISGGSDIDPKYYGQYMRSELGNIMPKRDKLEIELVRYALYETNIPILGICRGCQLLNVVSGGTLHQDMSYQENILMNHACLQSPKYYPVHSVQVDVRSKMAEIYESDTVDVNSYHHQAIDELGSGFKISMRAPDNTCEAIELPGERFVMAVQWHPEMMTEHDSKYLNIFEAFIKSCQKERVEAPRSVL